MPGNGQGGCGGRPERPRVPGAAAKPRPGGRGRSGPQQGPASVPPRALPDLGSPRPGPTCFRYSPTPALGAALAPALFPARPPARGRPSPPCPPWARSPRSARRFLPRAPPAFTSFPQPAPRRRKARWETPAAPQPRPRRGQSTARPGPVTPTPPWVLGTGPDPGPVTNPRYRPPARPLRPSRGAFVVPFPRRFSHHPLRHGGDRPRPGPIWRPREGRGDA